MCQYYDALDHAELVAGFFSVGAIQFMLRLGDAAMWLLGSFLVCCTI